MYPESYNPVSEGRKAHEECESVSAWFDDDEPLVIGSEHSVTRRIGEATLQKHLPRLQEAFRAWTIAYHGPHCLGIAHAHSDIVDECVRRNLPIHDIAIRFLDFSCDVSPQFDPPLSQEEVAHMHDLSAQEIRKIPMIGMGPLEELLHRVILLLAEVLQLRTL